MLEQRRLLAAFLVTTATDEAGSAADPPDGSGTSLREAITAANAIAGADTITFDTAGIFATPKTITLTLGELAITNALSITGTGASNLSISGNNASRIFKIDDLNSGTLIDVQIVSMTLSGGAADLGAAISNSETLTMSNAVIAGNSASAAGGGIANLAGTIALTNCSLSTNSAQYGGAIYNASTATLTNCTLSSNSGSFGGATYGPGAMTLANCTLSNNSASFWGGGIINDGSVTLTNCTLSGNSAASGGAIFNSGPATLTNCTLSGNVAYSQGAGIFNTGAATLINSTLSANSSYASGGGIFVDSTGILTVTNCTLSGNSAAGTEEAEGGGGIYLNSNPFYGEASSLAMNNTVVANSNGGNDLRNNGGNVSGSHNLVEDGSDELPDNIFGDPNLGPLTTANGGTTATFALLSGSPAINSGDDALAVDENSNPLTTDQRGLGYPRFVGIVDIGAFEVQNLPPTVTVNIVDASLNDGDSSSNVTFEFSENVLGFTAADLTAVGGTLSGFTAVDGDSYTATFTATDGFAGTGSVTVGTGYTDTTGNSGTTGSDTVAIDRLNPTVTVNIVDVSLTDVDSSSNVTFEFSENVAGFTSADLTAVGGTLSGFAAVDGNSYTATFTAPDGFDATGSVAVGTGYTDVAGNTGAGGSDTVAIDRVNPTVTVNIVDASLNNNGDNSSNVTFEFSENAIGFTAADLTAVGGTLSGFTTVDGNSYTATFTATASFAGTGTVTVGTGYTDAAGNSGTTGSDGADVNWPSNLLVDITADENDGNYSAGDLSLREAIALANAHVGPDVINFNTAGVFATPRTITITQPQLAITDSVTINGTGAQNLVIDTNYTTRVFEIDDATSNLAQVKITGMTLYRAGLNSAFVLGGGILNAENLTLSDVWITAGYATRGGGIYNTTSAVATLSNCLLSGNTGSQGGGAIYNSSASLTLLDCSLTFNSTASVGGAIFNTSGGAVLTNCTIFGNNANTGGGGISNFFASTTLRNCTVSDNGNGSGAGIRNENSHLVLNNTIVANSSGSDVLNIGNVSTLTGSRNLIESPITGDGSNSLTNTIVADPSLDTQGMAFNGGPTSTVALQSNSPAINAGSNALVPSGVITDQRGVMRFVGNVDIGAYEVNAATGPDLADNTKTSLYISGDDADDIITLSTSGSNVTVSIVNDGGTRNYSFPAASITGQIYVYGLGGEDTLITDGTATASLDQTTAAPVALSVAFNGGAGSDTWQFNGGDFTFTSDASASAENLQLAGDTAVTFTTSQHLDSLNITSGVVTLTAGGNKVIVTDSISISGTGTLDLTDNDLIVTGMSYDAVNALVKSGFGNYDWLGTGITSSTAAAFAQTDGSRAVGVIDNADWGYGTFSGQTVNSTDILVKFTYTADSNLDGLVDNDDFGQFLYGFNGGGAARWLNGDFDFNGVVDNDDFGWFLTGLAAFNASGGVQL